MVRSLALFAALAAAGAMRPETPEERAERRKTPPQDGLRIIDDAPGDVERAYRYVSQTDADRARLQDAAAKRARKAAKLRRTLSASADAAQDVSRDSK